MIYHPDLVELIFEYIGLTEIPGIENNPEIMKFFAEGNHNWVQGDETAWCTVTINALGARCGYSVSDKLNARSYLNIGSPIYMPQVGCIVVFWRGSIDSWMGHVAVYLGEDEKYIYCIGGNQSNKIKVSKYLKDRVLGYRRLNKGI
jgi:uncharacterized protein (TIGR02594 family)